MINADDVGGVHIKYLYHCPRQLWLYARGFRPEALSEAVQIKSASKPSVADEAQAIHYCYRLHKVGVAARGAVLHYPKTRRTKRITYTPAHKARAEEDIANVLDTVASPTSPERLERSACRGCSYQDYCWSD